MNRRLRLALVTLISLSAATIGVPATATASGPPSGPLAAQMNELLKLQPGGVQVSDNALVWGQGSTVVVWPSPGQHEAPRRLGSNVRYDQLSKLGAEFLVGDGIQDVHGCPSGVLKKDYYCFYTDANFGGRRLQFADTCTDSARSWGFDNQTTSWVNNDTDKNIYAYDNPDSTPPLYELWIERENSLNSNVGASKNDRMGSWGCSL